MYVYIDGDSAVLTVLRGMTQGLGSYYCRHCVVHVTAAYQLVLCYGTIVLSIEDAFAKLQVNAYA